MPCSPHFVRAANEAPDTSPRERLLAKAVDHVAAHGVADLSLRALAAALGTSHRMLLYHFGSKEQLWKGCIDWLMAGCHAAK